MQNGKETPHLHSIKIKWLMGYVQWTPSHLQTKRPQILIRSTQEDSGISSPIQRSHEIKFLAKQKWAVAFLQGFYDAVTHPREATGSKAPSIRIFSITGPDSPPLFPKLHVKGYRGTSLVGQWLRLHPPNARGPGFNHWSGNQIPHASTKNSHTPQ